MSESMTTYAAMLKEFYTKKCVEFLVYRNAALFAMLPKNTEIEGETWDIPIYYGDPAAASSATFATALANKTNTSTGKFQVPMRNEYSFASIDRKVTKASKSSLGAFLKADQVNIDGAFNNVKRSMGIHVYRDASGAKGRISSINDAGTNGIITLTNRWDALLWQKGEKFQLCDTKTGGTLRNSGNQATILGLNRQAGTITVSGKLSAAISAGAANDYMYRAGDYDAVITGLAAYIPSSAPSTALHGLTRTGDTDMLGGCRYDGSAQLVSEAFIDGLSECSALGDGNPDHGFLAPVQWRNLAKEMGAKVELRDYKVTQTISFKGFEVQYDGGVARIFSDRYCETTTGYGLELDSWEMGSMGACPEIFDEDLERLREASSDGFEIRIGGYPNLGCHAPGHNVNITLPNV